MALSIFAGASHADTIVGLGGRCATAVGEPARSKVVMKACKPDDSTQQWTRNRTTHQILNGKYCLEAGKSLIPGALVKVWHCDDDAVLQKWFVSGSRIDGYLNLCLNVAAEREDEPLNTWPCNSAPHQKWRFVQPERK